MKIKLFVVVIVVFSLLSLGIYSFINPYKKNNIVCTEEAKICPDGTSVVRVGPRCEFAQCPKSSAPTTVIPNTPPKADPVIPNISNTTRLNKKVVINGVSITPIELVSDTRCGVDVQCVWAGTVNIKVKIENGSNVQESKITLGKFITFLNVGIQLKNVLPQAYAGVSIKPEDYYFEFNIVPKEALKDGDIEKPIF